MTSAGFRKLALALPEVEERAHMGHPDFRVGGRIFATMGYPRAGWAAVALTPEDQGATDVILRHATVPAARDALASAYEARVLKTAKGGRTRKAPGRH